MSEGHVEEMVMLSSTSGMVRYVQQIDRGDSTTFATITARLEAVGFDVSDYFTRQRWAQQRVPALGYRDVVLVVDLAGNRLALMMYTRVERRRRECPTSLISCTLRST